MRKRSNHRGDIPQRLSPPPSPAIRLKQINKSFGRIQANRDIDLTVQSASIHGIIGENGAGKSTLMSILYGFYKADSGQIEIDGQPITLNSTADAIRGRHWYGTPTFYACA